MIKRWALTALRALAAVLLWAYMLLMVPATIEGAKSGALHSWWLRFAIVTPFAVLAWTGVNAIEDALAKRSEDACGPHLIIDFDEAKMRAITLDTCEHVWYIDLVSGKATRERAVLVGRRRWTSRRKPPKTSTTRSTCSGSGSGRS